jgi:DNA-3-methyladenine glycosylase
MLINKLPKNFYLQKCKIVARELIGKIMVRIKNKNVYAGIIVETEAYLGKNDPASHSYRGKTMRNEVMFGDGGLAYVYFTYGNHYCVNVVTEAEGIGNAVLIRAVEPVYGVERMKKNRGVNDIYNLASGPGKLTQAFEIDKSLNGADLTGDEIFIVENEIKYNNILRSGRVGITKNTEKKLRFYSSQNPFVSAKNFKKTLNR